eukprot:CAMPEP_0197674144 /NCGR_PEP_ID=MMETSP1338-20131121/82347_1 /TAXON_ID=43686 ORGANISM="Pelagodinium beii, Strain RCC1491" /NCGR_SAMPLE_ID=MMETSP1338 /ASSEMBLY_ACC=CAM_ASM_000754 /LENGTH=442 /DNA_ID=CAMNT_0043254489 /DNA_START=23 /DNA_END=1347 /DNA_ORIENTATION=-
MTELEHDVEDRLPVIQRLGIEARVPTMLEAMRPLYAALPKNENGELGHGAVRYALYRLFRQMHAWLVNGLTPSGQPWSTSKSLSDALDLKVPMRVAGLFKEHLDKSGFNLAETAFLAATLEELIFEEAIEKLNQSYDILGLGRENPLPWDSVKDVLEVYMMIYIFDSDKYDVHDPAVRLQIKDVYPNWPATQRFIRKQMREVTHKADGLLEYVEAEHIVTQMAGRYGQWQDIECRELKQTLLALESHCQGRVELGDFHGSALGDGKWQFEESGDYLRQLGSLDETVKEKPSVIVPNYIDSPSNYISTSETYAVVCFDECLPLLSSLEKAIGGPAASPKSIASHVKVLTTPSQREPRELPLYLLRHLDGIAKVHRGQVPLHGRLFAQFMHHAFPRECQYPAKSGTTKPMFPTESEAETGISSIATEFEMAASEAAMNEAHKAV